MPLISFRAERASVHIGVTHEGSKQRSIVLSVALEDDEDVETSDKRSLKGAGWSVILHEGEEFNASAKERQAIGFLTYHPESKMDYDFLPESCSASVAVAAPAFLAMWHLVSQGRLPDWISVSVEDMTYGYDPDGREKIWNIDANRSVAVKEVDFRFPVAAVPKRTSASEEELDTDPIGLPATSSDIQAASAQLGEVLANYHVSIKKELRYLIGVAALIALVLLFR